MSTESVVATIRASGERRAPLRITGRSNWLSAGRPVKADETLSLAADTGVVSYTPGDLTLTVRAGTSLREVERVTAEHEQWLPLDPYGDADGTIGATIATASSGPLATAFGTPRDLLLGIEFVTGRGDVVRAGGKVVKNVAGFDLTRLLTGSWGTLGVITEATVRLYARPKSDRTLVFRLGGSETQTASFLEAFGAAPLLPFAMEVVSVSVAKSLGLGEHPACLVRLGGNTAAVDSQLIALARLGRTDEVESRVWEALRLLDRDADFVIRLSGLPAKLRAAAGAMMADAIPGVYTCINIARGVVRIIAKSTRDAPAELAGFPLDGPVEGSFVFERLPAETWTTISPSVVADPLSQGIKRAYDPFNLLNPGILGD
ncbi:MAG TPA: FAD-binding protein [Gemmatimonadaceae bacterium]|nr:FAD-binding protein [Gemmatimonadaceae bacterium]